MKRFAKKTIAITMALALGSSFMGNVSGTYAKQAKPSVSKKVTMKVGQTKTLKIKKVSKSKIKKTTWKVGSKKKLKISKKTKNTIKIKALRTGTTTVKAVVKVGKKNYKLTTKVTIKKKSKPAVTPGGGDAVVPTQQPNVTNPPEPTPGQTKEESAEMKIMEKLPEVSTYEKTIVPPDLMMMLDGSKVTTKAQMATRQQEIRAMLQRYMYGIWRSGEEVSYQVDGSNINITIREGGKTASFSASYTCPTGTAPAGGWPVMVSVGGFSNSYVAQSGYATISFDPNKVASDNTARTGAFYTLYPYKTSDWKEQTGSVLAWAWGASKIIDALEKGAGSELGISVTNTIVTGVSRYGKAAAAAGAFESRFKVSMPVCSGYGGMTMWRYNSNNLTYNLLPEFENDPKVGDVSDLSAWKSTGGNEPINSLQGAGWFNDTFKSFGTYQNLPFDANYIAALSAREDHYMFIVTGINSDMWSSPPGFWWCYEEAKPAFDLMGLSDNFAIQMHLNLHGIETVDLCKLFTFTDYHFYDKVKASTTYPSPWNDILAEFKLADLKTCIFASEANKEAYEAGKPIDPSLIPPNPDVSAMISVMFGDTQKQATVKRSSESDALIAELTGEAAGKGFSFTYGPNKQYGFSYARFDLDIPEGKKISDYKSVTFTCQTEANYYGKKMALVVNPKDTGLPAEINYDYGSGAISNAINLSGGVDLPNNTSTAKKLTLDIDAAAAASLDGKALECTIYLHMEHSEGTAQYTISNIKFNE